MASTPSPATLMRMLREHDEKTTARCPVSPVHPVYAREGATVAGGKRLVGDFPLPPSGYLCGGAS